MMTRQHGFRANGRVMVVAIMAALAAGSVQAQVLESLRIEGPTEVVEQQDAYYRVFARFDNGQEYEVTLLSYLWLEPGDAADIDVFGRMQTTDIEEDTTEVIVAYYTFGSQWLTAELPVDIIAMTEAGYALDFDGTTDYVRVPSDPSLEPSAMTVEFWAYFDGPQSGNTRLVRKLTHFGRHGFIFAADQSNNHRVQLSIYGNSGVHAVDTTTHDAYIGGWHHFAGTYDESTIALYVDGVLVDVKSHTNGPLTHEDVDLIIGYGDPSPDPSEHFDGKIDEVRYWSYARSEFEIRTNMHRSLHGNEPGLIGYWQFNEGSGQIAHDSSSHENHGTLGDNDDPAGDEHDPQWIPSNVDIKNVPPAGYAMDFDGTEDYVRVPNDPSLEPEEFTIECWIYFDSAQSYHTRLFRKAKPFSTGVYLSLSQNGNNRLQLQVQNGTLLGLTDTQTYEYLYGQWHHVAGVYSATDASLYVDGELVNYTTHNQGPKTAKSDADLYLGYGGYESNEYFNGDMDEVRFWNYARSECEIRADMHRSLRGNEPGLVGYWTFDAGDGQIVHDMSGHGNDGIRGENDDPAGDTHDPAWVISEVEITDGPRDVTPYWTELELISEVSSGDDWATDVSDDGLEIYIASERDAFASTDIYVATRNSVHEPFGTPVVVEELSIPGYNNHDGNPCLSADGLTIYFSRHYGKVTNDMYVATRPSRNDPWGEPEPIESLNTSDDELSMTVTADQLYMVYVPRSGLGKFWIAQRDSTDDPWTPMGTIASLANYHPRSCDISPDGLTLYLTAGTASSASDRDIYVVSRNSRSEPFGAPKRITELSSTQFDYDISVNPDGDTLYIVRRYSYASDVFVSHLIDRSNVSLAGDLNDDCMVEWADFSVFAGWWMADNCSSTSWCGGADINHDGTVEWADFGLFAQSWGNEIR